MPLSPPAQRRSWALKAGRHFFGQLDPLQAVMMDPNEERLRSVLGELEAEEHRQMAVLVELCSIDDLLGANAYSEIVGRTQLLISEGWALVGCYRWWPEEEWHEVQA